jgi:hypothetical protein
LAKIGGAVFQEYERSNKKVFVEQMFLNNHLWDIVVGCQNLSVLRTKKSRRE